MPTAIAAYTPASSNAFNSRSRYSTESMRLGTLVSCLLGRRGCYWFAGCRIFGVNDIYFVVRLVLRDHKGIFGLSVGGKFQDLAREHGLLQLPFFKGIANGVFIQRTGSLDRLRHNAHTVIGRSGVPGIDVMAREGFVIGSKLFCLRIRQLIRPPDAGKNVVGTRTQRLAGVGFR